MNTSETPPEEQTGATAPTGAEVAVREREARALNARLAGASYAQVAQVADYADASGAMRAVKRALDRLGKDEAEELKVIEDRRLNMLLQAMFPKAASGDRLAVDRCLAIMESLRRLHGLDAPERHLIEVVTHDEFVKVMETLEREVAEMEAKMIEAGDADIDLDPGDVIEE